MAEFVVTDRDEPASIVGIAFACAAALAIRAGVFSYSIDTQMPQIMSKSQRAKRTSVLAERRKYTANAAFRDIRILPQFQSNKQD